jgi:hypothetical protein
VQHDGRKCHAADLDIEHDLKESANGW